VPMPADQRVRATARSNCQDLWIKIF
jgi:hypothetical protein